MNLTNLRTVLTSLFHAGLYTSSNITSNHDQEAHQGSGSDFYKKQEMMSLSFLEINVHVLFWKMSKKITTCMLSRAALNWHVLIFLASISISVFFSKKGKFLYGFLMGMTDCKLGCPPLRNQKVESSLSIFSQFLHNFLDRFFFWRFDWSLP